MAKNRRVNVKAILADPDLRRKLMVSTIQATQAREGIDTTEEQADRAYHVVSEGERTAFFDLVRFGRHGTEADQRHAVFVSNLYAHPRPIRHDVARRDFRAIEGSPLAFRQVGLVAHIFRDSPSLEPRWGIARQGKATGDDSRWVRYWWEVVDRAGWVPFAKGGDFSRFFADVHLVLDWRADQRKELKAAGNGFPSKSLYFRAGITWPRAASVFNARLMPDGCVFADKGPVVIPAKDGDEFFLLAILNSDMALCFAKTLTSREKMGGRWEVGIVKRFPIPEPAANVRALLESLAKSITKIKSRWDSGNETSSQFHEPWLFRRGVVFPSDALQGQLATLAIHEAREQDRIQEKYSQLNDEVYNLYGILGSARAAIEETLGDRPAETLWPQMAGKTDEQKRMEHVWRLLSYVVKRVVEMDEDGIVPFAPLSGETSLLDRVHDEIEVLFPDRDVNQVEVEIANELKRTVKGYKRASSIDAWLKNIYFDYHASLYKKRPIIWHIASSQDSSTSAFGALCHYHKFDANRMAKLRAGYLRDAIEAFRREAALADREGRTEDRIEWQGKLEETQALDRKLQAVQEGHHEGAKGGDSDYRILTPWKSPEDRPKGWTPDIDDGVKVNIEPLQKAGVLRIWKVV